MQSHGSKSHLCLSFLRWTVTDVQVEHLILDLAVQRQFDQTKREMEAMALDAKSLQEELQAVQFSQDSKAGRMLMAKCRALQVCAPQKHAIHGIGEPQMSSHIHATMLSSSLHLLHIKQLDHASGKLK